MHNALIYLYGDTGRVPHKISKFLYHNSSEEGVATREMENILDLVRKEYNLKILVYRNRGVTESIIRRYLPRGDAVMICDTNAGSHSILVTGLMGNELLAFDPRWGNVARCDHSEERFRCCPYGDRKKALLNPHHNVSIHIDHLLKDTLRKKERFVMGSVRQRSALIISRTDKRAKRGGDAPFLHPALAKERFSSGYRLEA